MCFADSAVADRRVVSAASDVHGAITLVQHHILRTQLSCWRAVPCVDVITNCGWLHRPFKQ